MAEFILLHDIYRCILLLTYWAVTLSTVHNMLLYLTCSQTIKIICINRFKVRRVCQQLRFLLGETVYY